MQADLHPAAPVLLQLSRLGAECTEASREACEIALAHVDNDRTEVAYHRTGLLKRGRTLIQQRADYLVATA